MVNVLNGGLSRDVAEAVFFPYDTYNVPLLDGLSTTLIPGSKHAEPVVRFGDEGQVDQHNVRYFGSVVKAEGRMHMWYLGGGASVGEGIGSHPPFRPRGICYAVSDDGVHWEKPNLGLVEHNGTRDNNLVDLDCADIATGVIIHDPDDPDPDRRFKTMFDCTRYDRRPAVAFSGDGLRWKVSERNPVIPHRLEVSGLVRLGDAFYCNGQSAGKRPRMLCTVMSYDFENWTSALNVGLRRDDYPGQVRQYGNNPLVHFGPQVHLGASLWDRGNSLLGIYGMWNGPDEDRNSVYMDLGLVVTADAVHYDEPVRDFPIVLAREEPDGSTPALMQGQGFENTDDRTLFWYSAWREGEVRLATWERDRLGYVSVDETVPSQGPHLWTTPMRFGHGGGRIFLNISGLSEHSRVSVSVTDERFHPLAGLESRDMDALGNGLRLPVTWGGLGVLRDVPDLVRIRIDFGGVRAHDARLYAVYVEQADGIG